MRNRNIFLFKTLDPFFLPADFTQFSNTDYIALKFILLSHSLFIKNFFVVVCTQLLVSTRPEDECFSMYLQMLDKCMMHEVCSFNV